MDMNILQIFYVKLNRGKHMRKVVTINKKIEFDSELSEVQTSVTK